MTQLKEISALEQSIEMHLVALSETFNPSERMMYKNNIDRYQTRYIELTGHEYKPSPTIFKNEEKYHLGLDDIGEWTE